MISALYMFYKLFWIAVAGSLGALSRYGISIWFIKTYRKTFPYETLIINVAGCLLAGIIWELSEKYHYFNGEIKFVILVGFLGAFTTFSTFALESSRLFAVSPAYAILNILFHNILGIFAFFLGTWLLRLV